MSKMLLLLAASGISLTFLVFGMLYFMQERLIFFPEKLSSNFEFSFSGKFEELEFITAKDVMLHGLHFRAENPRGVVLYFHGNAGSLEVWGHVAQDFVEKGYDMIMIDYRGYGKSSGKISNEKMLHLDAEYIYSEVMKIFPEENIVIYGRSLGTGIATKLAVNHHPKLLFLETPYYNFEDVVKHHYQFIPTKLVLKYQFSTDLFIKKVKCPVILIHGTEDELIPYHSSERLAQLSGNISLITIKGGRHNDLPGFDQYQQILKEALN